MTVCPECDNCGFSSFEDRYGNRRLAPCADSWPTCDRCIEMCVAFHDDHGIGHLVPSALRQRRSDLAARQPVLKGDS